MATQPALFDDDRVPASYRRLYAEMAERGITVAPTPPQYCDLCGVEDDCLLMLDAPGYPDDLVDCCGECAGSKAILAKMQ